MANDEDFRLMLGRSGRAGGDGPFLHRVMRSANLAGGIRPPRSAAARRRFDGSRIGRGAGIGRVLSTREASSRRAVVKVRIVKLAGNGAASAHAHMRYLQRDGTTRTGERGTLYSRDLDIADGRAFHERGSGDRHQFRFIVAAEDGAEYDDLKHLTRRLMAQVEEDLRTRLDWVAVDHFNTGHPHSHIIVRGKDHEAKDLIIAREYISEGLRARAVEIVSLELGPRSYDEILRAQLGEMTQERFTSIDRRLLEAIDGDGLVSAGHADGVEQAARAGRLQTLSRLGLAVEEHKGRWRLDEALEPTLRAMGKRGDIIATLHREMRERSLNVSPADYAVFDPGEGKAEPIVGRVVTVGLSDEHEDHRYLIVDGADGHSHYVDIGFTDPAPAPDAIVHIAARPIAIRESDRTVAEVAAANGGEYDVTLHLRHDPNATDAYAQTHVRRLEAIRRTIGAVERLPSGTWIISPDHLERVEEYERQLSSDAPVIVETLSSRPLDRLPTHEGATWLDRELLSDRPTDLQRGFGAEVRKALDLRRQWLIEQQLAEVDGDSILYKGNLLAILQRRELTRVARTLSRELGLEFAEAQRGEHIEGIYRRAVRVGDSKFALIEKSREFTLVPWRPVLERQIDKAVSGIMRGDSISWTIGRSRGIVIS